MLEQVEWGEFRLGDLFEVITIKGLDEGKFNLLKNQKKDFIEFVGRTRVNNGVKGYIKKIEGINVNPQNVISISQIGTITAQIRNNERYGSQNIFMLTPNEHQELISLFCVGAINTVLYGTFSEGYSNYPTLDKLKNLIIQLPIKNGEIDFEFMDNFIAELEKKQQTELNSYLEITGLKNYELTNDELKVLKDFGNGKVEWKEFKIEKVLDRMPQKEIDPLKIPNLKIEGKCKYPFYGQSTLNNGVISYECLKDSVLNNSNGFPTILIHSNNQNVIYLESPFYLKDGHGATSVLQNEHLNKLNAMFIITVISKIIKQKFSYQTKATKIALKNTEIKLPIKDNQPDYNLMEVFISAIHKLVIKDLVLYNQERLKATAQVING